MKRAAAALLLLTTVARGQTLPATQPFSPAKTYTFDLSSKLGRTYRIFIAEPVTPATAPLASLLVLDANAMFATAVESARQQRGVVPALIIGVGYPTDGPLDVQRRYYDFSPRTAAEQISKTGPDSRATPDTTGGQDEFLDFIETELRPLLAQKYTLDPNRRAVFGHSLAGRLVLHALLTRPGMFTHFIAASPSIWWGNHSLASEVEPFVRRPPSTKLSLLMVVGDLEQQVPPGTPPDRAAFIASARMVDAARELSERIGTVANVESQFHAFPDETHGSVVAISLTRAIRFALTAPAAR